MATTIKISSTHEKDVVNLKVKKSKQEILDMLDEFQKKTLNKDVIVFDKSDFYNLSTLILEDIHGNSVGIPINFFSRYLWMLINDEDEE